eukprot:gene17336-biopygen801
MYVQRGSVRDHRFFPLSPGEKRTCELPMLPMASTGLETAAKKGRGPLGSALASDSALDCTRPSSALDTRVHSALATWTVPWWVSHYCPATAHPTTMMVLGTGHPPGLAEVSRSALASDSALECTRPSSALDPRVHSALECTRPSSALGAECTRGRVHSAECTRPPTRPSSQNTI